ncbi:hypothetical protein PENDEC_c034G05871 [Penicillium decumbens]|uniref:NmrA-like domain-containing protein n=1 Tax=Penicillium decumbens TaxID=69771 RepID=A0A1V6NV22_PENDC|nr:hypothetical protein PENDEC_c034G05871 [Penicillium decumbens]
MSKIGVFPASGGLGGSTINHLSKLVPASQLILIARKPEKLVDFEKAGSTVRHADYDKPETLENAFEGVDVLMLISYASFEIEHRIKVHRIAIDAAVASGVKHIFYSSLAFAGLTNHSVAHVMGAHLQTEAYLSSLTDKITYTAVREGIYSESYPIYTNWFNPSNPGSEITIPHDGSGPGVAWVKRDDLGEATARLVVSYTKNPTEFKYTNEKVILSGQKSYSLAETVEILGRVVGRDLKIREISVDEYAKLEHYGRHTYHGINLAREWATAWDAIRRGETDVVTPDIREILGREPEDYEVTIRGSIG